MNGTQDLLSTAVCVVHFPLFVFVHVYVQVFMKPLIQKLLWCSTCEGYIRTGMWNIMAAKSASEMHEEWNRHALELYPALKG